MELTLQQILKFYSSLQIKLSMPRQKIRNKGMSGKFNTCHLKFPLNLHQHEQNWFLNGLQALVSSLYI